MQVSNPFADLIPGGQPEAPVAPPGTRLVPRPPPGYRLGADGHTLEPIPGGPADRSAQREPPSGYRETPTGYEPVPGGPADPNAQPTEAPSGYRYNAQGNLEPIPGGPADRQQPSRDMETALGEIRNTVRNAREAQRMSRQGWFATGFGAGAIGNRLPGGTTAADLRSLLTQIGSNTAFDRLQRMRAESPTGGALGSVSERELQLLQNSVAALDVTQSDDQFNRSMQAVIDNYSRVYQQLGGNPAELQHFEIQPQRQQELRPGETGVGGVPLAHALPPSPEVPPGGEQFRTDLEQAVNSGQLQTADAIVQYGREHGFNIDPAQADAAIRNRARGVPVSVTVPRFEAPDISDMRGEGGVVEGTDATLRAASNAVSFGLADRAEAVADSVFSGGTYDENLRRQHAITAYDWQQHPYLSTLGTVGGAVLLPTSARTAGFNAAQNIIRSGGTRAAAVAAARNAAAARLGAEGAGYGFAHGFSTSQGDLLDRFANGTVEAIIGGGTGVALPFGADAARRGGRAVASVFQGAPGLAQRVVFRAIRADGNSPANLSRQVAAGEANDVPVMLADTGENARGAMSASARAPGAGRSDAIQGLDTRQDQLPDRLISHIERDLGPIANPHQLADDLMTTAQTNAAPLYEAAYARPGADTFGSRVASLLGRPSMRRAMQNARRIAEEEGRDPTTLGFEINSSGEVTVSRVPSWQTLDYIKRGMDDVVESYRDPTSGRLNLDTEGRAVNNTLRSFLRAFDEANPDYAAARAAYGGPVRGIDAMNRGRRALSMTADDLEAVMRDMTPFDRDMFRLGARRAMAELVESRGDTANMVNSLVGTGKKRAMLARLFGDRREFERFVDTLDLEQAAHQTYRRARTGSPTAPNMADDTELAVATGVGDLMTTGTPILSFLRLASRTNNRRMAQAAQAEIARMLGETDPARIRELIQRFRREESRLLTRRRTTRATAAASRTAVDLTPEVSAH